MISGSLLLYPPNHKGSSNESFFVKFLKLIYIKIMERIERRRDKVIKKEPARNSVETQPAYVTFSLVLHV